MSAAWIWLGLMALALIGEVMSGTFYLLIVAVGLAAAALAAWFGLGLAIQLGVCAVVVVLAMLALRRLNVLKKRSGEPSRNANLNMDIGQTVKVDAWNSDGTTRVWYRGAHWQAELVAGAIPTAGMYIITEMRGSSLVLTPQA